MDEVSGLQGRERRKRSFDEFKEDGGVAAALRAARHEQRTAAQEASRAEEGWTVVDQGMKKRKTKNKKAGQQQSASQTARDSNKPALTIAALHKLNSNIKVSDLQTLVLYCLADGTAPQWVAVSNRGQVRKAVVLMVPGLDKGFFSGEIKLEIGSAVESTNGQDGGPPNGEAPFINTPDEAAEPAATDGHPKVPGASATRSDDREDYLSTPSPVVLKAEDLPSPLKPLADIFTNIWPVKAPGDDRHSKLHSPLHGMLTAPISQSRAEKHGKGPQPPKAAASWIDERTPITAFTASRNELQENDYVLHPALFDEGEKPMCMQLRTASKTLELDGWRDTCVDDLREFDVPDSDVEDGSITAGRTVLAVDCEMCLVEGDEYALTRVSIVNWDGDIVLDEFVKPEKPIKDYLTPFSGISAESLKDVTISLQDVQEKLLALFHPRTILIGQSLESDLRALKMTHPFIVDTTILFPHPRGPPLKSSLKFLAQKYLSREIQKGHGTKGHDSVEDAQACLDLVKQKCEKGAKWGTSEASGEPIFKRLAHSPSPYAPAVQGQPRPGRTGAMVDRGLPEKSFGSTATFSIGCETDNGVCTGIRRAVRGDTDGAEIPSGGVDFTFARLRDLEALRGWQSDSRLANDRRDYPNSAKELGGSALTQTVVRLVDHITTIRATLPPCTLFIVYSGSGDPRDLLKLQEQYRTFKKEYAYKKWDELSVQWTDVEEQALKGACKKARSGIGFMCIT